MNLPSSIAFEKLPYIEYLSFMLSSYTWLVGSL